MIYQGYLKGAVGSSEIKGKCSYGKSEENFYLSQHLLLESDDDEFEDSSDQAGKSDLRRGEGKEEESGEAMKGREAFVNCSQGHTLQWTNSSHPGGHSYGCNNCRKSGYDTSAGKWHCSRCKYDICGNYRNKSLNEVEEEEEEEPFINCAIGHHLKWVVNLEYPEGTSLHY